MSITIRPATPDDVEFILQLIRDLATFEKAPDAVKATVEDLLRDGFGPHPRFESLIAQLDDRPAGFALYFYNYSTWEGTTGIHLEDIFVLPWARGHGVGRALIGAVAMRAKERRCPRLDLSVLHWNPAREVYRKLGFVPLSERVSYRLEGEALSQLAARTAEGACVSERVEPDE
ncbi:MAG TPA: GNAT family N-acetyltransferase [Polyangiaceae bacterium]|nr:GNAT family N-acetyltransferase [Polyangiaceae bacterium]